MKESDMYVQAGVVLLSDEDARFVREHKALIDQQKMILVSLEHTLVNRLRVGYGVDIDRENWELDLDRGILRKQAGPHIVGTHTYMNTSTPTNVETDTDTSTHRMDIADGTTTD